MLRTLFGTLAMWLVMLSSAGQSVTGVRSDAPRGVRTGEAPSAQPASFAITHVSLIDGTGSPPRSDMTVIVRAGRIEFVGPAREEPLGSEISAIDGRGKFLLPGLIDTHAHVTYLNWSGGAAAPGTGTYDDVVSRASLRLLLAFGITTVRNPGGLIDTEFRIQESEFRMLSFRRRFEAALSAAKIQNLEFKTAVRSEF